MIKGKSVYKYLPQRPPFLFVDGIKKLDEGSVVTYFKFNKDWDIFHGHFPYYPLVPGTILTEAMAQAATILAIHIHPQNGKLGMLVKISNATFHHQVKPDDVVQIFATLKQNINNFYTFSVEVKVNTDISSSAELTIYVGDANV